MRALLVLIAFTDVCTVWSVLVGKIRKKKTEVSRPTTSHSSRFPKLNCEAIVIKRSSDRSLMQYLYTLRSSVICGNQGGGWLRFGNRLVGGVVAKNIKNKRDAAIYRGNGCVDILVARGFNMQNEEDFDAREDTFFSPFRHSIPSKTEQNGTCMHIFIG